MCDDDIDLMELHDIVAHIEHLHGLPRIILYGEGIVIGVLPRRAVGDVGKHLW